MKNKDERKSSKQNLENNKISLYQLMPPPLTARKSNALSHMPMAIGYRNWIHYRHRTHSILALLFRAIKGRSKSKILTAVIYRGSRIRNWIPGVQEWLTVLSGLGLAIWRAYYLLH